MLCFWNVANIFKMFNADFGVMVVVHRTTDRGSDNLVAHGLGIEAIEVGDKKAERFNLEKDEKHTEWKKLVIASVTNYRLAYCYGLFFNAFANFSKNGKDKTALRDDLQKVLKLFRSEYKFTDSLLVPSVMSAINDAQKLKYKD